MYANFLFMSFQIHIVKFLINATCLVEDGIGVANWYNVWGLINFYTRVEGNLDSCGRAGTSVCNANTTALVHIMDLS